MYDYECEFGTEREARYTETLADYLNNGHTLPTIFNQITDFDDLFVAEYFNQEIGFETEDMFEARLEGKANVVIPFYKTKMEEIADIIDRISAPDKQTETTNSGQDVTVNNLNENHSGADITTSNGKTTLGATKQKQTELPINAASATPNKVIDQDQVINSSDGNGKTVYGQNILNTGTVNFKHGHAVVSHVTGLSVEDNMMIQRFVNDINNLLDELLREFRPLFMQVY